MYAEATGTSNFRTQSLEEELITLWALDVRLAEDLRALFHEAVVDSLSRALGDSGAHAAVSLIGSKSLGSPRKVCDGLDAIFGEGSEFLKSAIAQDFRFNIHSLAEKLKGNSAREASLIPYAVSRSRQGRGITG
jgi:hypothetical protein